MDVSFMLVADYANSTVDGKLYIMGVFSRISASQFPVVVEVARSLDDVLAPWLQEAMQRLAVDGRKQ